ncbi:MFS transporter [Pseudonocardia halophobica]|uniref:MFS-type transporter YdeG n=1 Tax=Pseudonocardia halophobica TaxID=29401 RepID=A0A9W6UF77_9PSEU|nr:MFS transporter [Pseudonocardia halophobica]GLL15501.1 putative MFS-type transporter YdeG [Pseudonocardia halophobica]
MTDRQDRDRSRSPDHGPASTEPPEQRRILRTLVLAQVFSGAGLAAGITVGALLAQDMLGATSLAGLPIALFTVGSAAAAAGVGRLSQRFGRRPGLTTGYAVGAAGSAGVVLAAVADSVPLLFAALVVYGAGTATNLQARYTGADLAAPARRGRAVSTVLVATTLGGVLGPTLVSPMGRLATAWGLPPLAGPFLLSGTAYLLAALVLGLLLRPDPLHLARERAAAVAISSESVGPSPTSHEATGTAGTGGAEPGGVALGASVMVLTQLVMVAIMTMTPVHMAAHGHGVGAAGAVIAVHVAAMYLPSPLSGWLVDRYGRLAVAALSGITLLAAGVLAATAPTDSVVLLALALALLGLGWNLGLVSGTAIITDAVPLERRAATQGTVDVGIAVAGAGGGLASGLVVAAAGYPALAVAGGVVALAIIPIVAAGSRARRHADPAAGTTA